MIDPLKIPKNAVENLRKKLMGSFYLGEIDARQIAFGGFTDQCAAQHVGLYCAAMVELSDLLVEKWRWIDRVTFLDRWLCYKHWMEYSTEQLIGVHAECSERLRRSLALIQNQPPEYVKLAEDSLTKGWSKIQIDTTLGYTEVRIERVHSFVISLVHGLKWLIVTAVSTVIGVWIGRHMGKMP
jgi:hypothetical protein